MKQMRNLYIRLLADRALQSERKAEVGIYLLSNATVSNQPCPVPNTALHLHSITVGTAARPWSPV